MNPPGRAAPNATSKLSLTHIDLLLFLLLIVNFGNVWIWPVDSEIQVVVAKPLGIVLHAIVLLGLPYVVFRSANVILRAARSAQIWVIALIVMWCAATALWSIDPMRTLVTSLDIATIVLVSVNCAIRVPTARILTAVFWLVATIIVVSAALATLNVKIAIMDGGHAGRWRGLFPHKNNMAEFIAFTFMLLFSFHRSIRVGWVPKIVVLIIAAITIIRAGSAGGLAIMLISATIILCYGVILKISRNALLLALTAIIIGAAVYAMDWDFVGVVTSLLGRDETFTGRREVWQFFYNATLRSPWFGHGYATYFVDNDLVWAARASLFATIRSPHNAYIAMALGAGWTSVVAFLAWAAIVATKALAASDQAVGRTSFVICISVCIFSFFEVSGAVLPSIGLVMLSFSAGLLTRAERPFLSARSAAPMLSATS